MYTVFCCLCIKHLLNLVQIQHKLQSFYPPPKQTDFLQVLGSFWRDSRLSIKLGYLFYSLQSLVLLSFPVNLNVARVGRSLVFFALFVH